MTKKKYYTVGTVPKSNRKIVERNKTISLSEMHNLSLSSVGTGTPIKHGAAKLILWTQLFPVSEKIRS
jgi:hypothetical protein